MRKYILIILLIAGLMITACNRFDNSLTKPSEESHEVGDLIVSTFESLNTEELEPLNALFHEDYLYDGISQEARIAEITALFAEHENLSFEAKITSEKHIGAANAELNWQLIAYVEEELCYNNIFTGDKAIKEGGSWKLLGNMLDSEEEETPAQLVIAEYFTFSTCPNCPPAEEKLRDLAQAHPNFIFLEHHTMIHYVVTGNDNHGYYGNPSAPAAVFQGQNVITGSSADALASYEAIVDSYIDEPAVFEYSIDELNIDGGVLSAKVIFDSKDAIDFEDMYLNYVVVANEMVNPVKPAENFYNVVRGLGRQSISASDMNQPIEINVNLPADMPTSGKLVVYIQKRPAVFSHNARIYGGEVLAFN
ncbi:MAG: hypothetical protein LHW60_03500 [Candidatus Cloacimonetes bacterium]|jgi:hypothetical protein|nr:hypothetical protein [Candidatus Cloacimonadota bacterium]NLO44459.1 hypothetical protein [Candidatus Cloacimonadota bacterium]